MDHAKGRNRLPGEGVVILSQKAGQLFHFDNLLSRSNSVYQFSPTLRSAGEGAVIIIQQAGQALHGVTLLSVHS